MGPWLQHQIWLRCENHHFQRLEVVESVTLSLQDLLRKMTHSCPGCVARSWGALRTLHSSPFLPIPTFASILSPLLFSHRCPSPSDSWGQKIDSCVSKPVSYVLDPAVTPGFGTRESVTGRTPIKGPFSNVTFPRPDSIKKMTVIPTPPDTSQVNTT